MQCRAHYFFLPRHSGGAQSRTALSAAPLKGRYRHRKDRPVLGNFCDSEPTYADFRRQWNLIFALAMAGTLARRSCSCEHRRVLRRAFERTH